MGLGGHVPGHPGGADLLLHVVVEHEEVGVDSSALGDICGRDVDAAAGEGHEAPVLDGRRAAGGGVDDDLCDCDFIAEDQLVLDLEELHEGLFADDAAAGCGGSFCPVWEGGFDGLAVVGDVVAPDVVGVEVADEAAGSGEVLVGVVGGVDGGLVIEVLADKGVVDGHVDAVLGEDAVEC